MTLAPRYEAISCEISGKPSIREKPAEFLGTGHQFYYHQLSIILMRVWRCLFWIVMLYLQYLWFFMAEWLDAHLGVLKVSG
jgi:hypothetical protein